MATWTDFEVNFLLTHTDLSHATVGRLLGRSRGSVIQKRHLIKKTGEPYRKPGPLRGEGHHSARLTEELVLAMRKRYAEGKAAGNMSMLKLAIEFDTEVSTTQGVISRRTWTHI